MKKLFFCILIFSFLFSAAGDSSRYRVRTALDSNSLRYSYVENDPFAGREYTLENGLKVYLSRSVLKPRIRFKMAVRAGIADSPADATGLAHYFEHMMFKGTDRIGALDYKKEKVLLDKIEQLFEEYRKTPEGKKKQAIYAEIDRISYEAAKYASAGEYSALISRIGGTSLNASTSADATLYVVDIPSGELEKLLILESERMRNPVMRLFHTELEAVFEEYNRSCDNDSFLAHEALWSKLFYPHPYSWVPFIGKVQHLKNPSITRIREFFRKYYVPSNMALTLAGDLDYDKTIRLVRKYFSHFPSGKKVIRNLKKASPLKKNEFVTVKSPKAGFQLIGFRLEKGRRNEILGYLLGKILSNGSAGLMDQNLVRAQKVLSAGAYCAERKDYSYFLLWGRPRAGQNFEELSKLLLSELQKVKEGAFDPLLLEGIKTHYRKSLAEAQDDPDSALLTYIDSFIKEVPYVENLRILDDLGKITKKEIVHFARSLGHYVRVDKVTGASPPDQKVKKPPMTPVVTNSHQYSAYAKEFMKKKSAPLPEGDFLTMGKDLLKMDIGKGETLLYSKRPLPRNRKLFIFQIILKRGSNSDPLLETALAYMKLLGTGNRTADSLRKELYANGISLDINCSAEQTILSIQAFHDRKEKAFSLAKEYLTGVKADEKVYQAFIARLLKSRADRKKDQNSNFSALNHFAAYGNTVENNPTLYRNSVDEKRLRSLRGADLVSLVQKYFRTQERIYAYVGPDSPQEVKRLISLYFPAGKETGKKEPVPENRVFRLQKTHRSTVYLLPYDSKQFLFGIRARKGVFSLEKLPYILLFNEYFGAGGLDSIVFREIRESRSLAYSAYAYYNSPMEKGKCEAFVGVVGTQSDKFFEAADSLLALFRKIPVQENQFLQAKGKLVKALSSSRRYGLLTDFYFGMEKMGIKGDHRKELLESLQKLTLKDIVDFGTENVSAGAYDLFILGPVKELDFKRLSRYGKIRLLTQKEVFGY